MGRMRNMKYTKMKKAKDRTSDYKYLPIFRKSCQCCDVFKYKVENVVFGL